MVLQCIQNMHKSSYGTMTLTGTQTTSHQVTNAPPEPPTNHPTQQTQNTERARGNVSIKNSAPPPFFPLPPSFLSGVGGKGRGKGSVNVPRAKGQAQ